jgi:hypothetical protein
MPENREIVSSGSSSKNEVGIVNVPLERPIGRFVATLLEMSKCLGVKSPVRPGKVA